MRADRYTVVLAVIVVVPVVTAVAVTYAVERRAWRAHNAAKAGAR